MMMQPQQPPQVQQQPQPPLPDGGDDDDTSDEEDRKPISRAYKTLGGKTGVGRGWRIEFVELCTNDKFTAMSLADLDTKYLDMLLYIACGVKPLVKLCDLRIKHKKSLKMKLKVLVS